MCGIAGWYRRWGAPVEARVIERQCDAILHRGPDDAGYRIDHDLGMGMRRLAIVDIAGGHQPIETPDGRLVIVYNGEIYNHRDLRRPLEAAGWTFRTQSDTETLLAGYAVWGDAVWSRLNGMFATAIWDRQTRTLTLARDPLGIKPLYLTEQDGGLAFGSELRTLTLLPGHRFDLDDRAVHDYFQFGHIQRPRSIYRQVRQLDPGHVLRIGPEGEARSHAYWTPRFAIAAGRSEADWIDETRERVMQTVGRHMLSDVPVGAFLSGGVDSSAILAAMRRQTDQPIKAFTIGFPGNRSDETDAAAATARHLGCEHVVLPIDLGHAHDIVPRIVRDLDEPLGASAVIPCWYVSRLAAEHVKVVLCGEGGDEMFAGYKRHRNALAIERWSSAIRLLGHVAGLAGAVPLGGSRRWNLIRQQIGRVRDFAALGSGYERFIAGTQITTPDLRARLLAPGFRRAQEHGIDELVEEYFGVEAATARAPMLEQFILGDLQVHMPGALLPRLDRTSMAHSLEARVPFLSHDFVDWCLTIPLEMKVRGRGKHVLREAVRPWLPEGILDRPKQGFQMPVSDWFLGSFADYAREVWHDSGMAAAGYLDPAAVDALFADHREGRANHGKILYAITVFACWWRDTLSQSPAQAA